VDPLPHQLEAVSDYFIKLARIRFLLARRSRRRQRAQIKLPLIEVDFSEANAQLKKDLPNLTSLEVPHRLADAILRDTMAPDGKRFPKSEYAERWRRANLWNAMPIYELCPTALVFGMWGSPEKPYRTFGTWKRSGKRKRPPRRIRAQGGTAGRTRGGAVSAAHGRNP